MQKLRVRFAYKSGFRRLWAVVSIIWLSIGGWRLHDSGIEFFQLCVIPVLSLYVLGAASVWIIEGFAKADWR